MMEQEIKDLWKNASDEYQVKIDKTLLIFKMDKELNKWDRVIKFRNIREVGVSVLMILFFSYVFVYLAIPLARIGIVLGNLGLMYIIYKIYSTRLLAKDVDTSLSIMDQLNASRKYWLAESLLLKRVHYWYLLPLVPGYVCFVWGTSQDTVSLVARLAFGLAINTGVYFLNIYAEKTQIQPLLHKIDDAIIQLEK